MNLLTQPKRVRGRAKPLKELGKHPQTGEEMNVMDGRYGPYVKMGKINVSLPDDLGVEEITNRQAIELLAVKLSHSVKKSLQERRKRFH